ncbi:MAG TPA: glycosyltransferase family 2 protein [Vicinamibacterales bacterium]|jgi:glycosyltransferase involved in cell wall biosynthesis|nr:glycosyltransferase family 2 protein [Vicinamibacterales bacterium]
MIKGKKVVVVMPAFNAERTIEQTWREVVEQEVVDLVIVVDDGSRDRTAAVARSLGKVVLHSHPNNLGYGANQKTCYRLALQHGADIIVMVHPDYQYTPKLIPAMADLVATGLYECVLGSRILGGRALKGGMPIWRYVANRGLTLVGNLLLGSKVSEFHTGYRAFSRTLLERLPLDENSDDFVFDNDILAETVWLGYAIGEVSCPTRYAPDASSITFSRSVRYGFGCLATACVFRLCKLRLASSKRFPT